MEDRYEKLVFSSLVLLGIVVSTAFAQEPRPP